MSAYVSNYPQDKCLIIVTGSEYETVRKYCIDNARVGWEQEFAIEAIQKKALVRNELKKYKEDNTEQILSRVIDDNVANIVVIKDAQVNIEALEQNAVTVRKVSCLATLLRVVKVELESRGLFWLTWAKNEYQKSSIRDASPDVFMQQFAELGFREIGKELLRSLRVLTDADFRTAFKIPEMDSIGLRVLHAYVEDDEPGSSSIVIKNVLEHLYPSADIVKLNVNNLDNLVSLNADIVFVYEDGLWSGVELVKRLSAICQSPIFQNSAVQLHFKYCVVSDAGLIAARLFAKREKNARLQFGPVRPENFFQFLRSGFKDQLLSLADSDDASIRRALDAEIEPYAFRGDAKWGDNRDSALSICTQIGQQLIRPFLERRKEQKARKNGDCVPGAACNSVTDEDVTNWALGACRFASTVVFASSVPKPVLPLFWLDGEVRINGHTVQWRPLFWDVRRTGKTDNS